MNQMQEITLYFKIVYGLVAVALGGYALYLAREGRRARARIEASGK